MMTSLGRSILLVLRRCGDHNHRVSAVEEWHAKLRHGRYGEGWFNIQSPKYAQERSKAGSHLRNEGRLA